MSYTVGDGYKFKMSRGRDAALSAADGLIVLAAEALNENDVATSTALLECSREIRNAIKKLREKMP